MADEKIRPAEILDWDSAFWGFCTARVNGDCLTANKVGCLDDWCREEGVRCLYYLARSDDPAVTRLAEGSGFRFVDIRLTLERACARSKSAEVWPSPGEAVFREARPEDLAALQSIARESHRDSRFYFDPGFPRSLCDLLYATWIQVELAGSASQVLVSEVAGVAAGYIACRLDPSTRVGRISLVGVQRQAQGKGIGKVLVDRALDWFASREAANVLVTTQGRNVAAQRLYQRCGFVTKAVELWYHKWYSVGGNLWR